MSRQRTVERRVLKVADRLFYQKGIRAVGIDELIREADIAKASLYQNFGSKEEIVARYLQARSDKNIGALRSAVEDAPNAPEARVAAMFKELEHMTSGADFRGCAFANACADLSESARVVEISRDYKQAIYDLFKVALGEGVAGAEGLAEQFCYLFDGAIVHRNLRQDMDAATKAAAAAMALIAASTTEAS
jgi:AcrR family transcriptional regulator